MGTEAKQGTRVLVVDDEATLRKVISQVLTDEGYEVTGAASAEEAIQIFREKSFPLVITDIIMGKMNGLELLQEIKTIESETLVVVMTSNASLETATQAIRAGAYDYLIKPFEDIDLISAVVHRAVERLRLIDDNRTLIEQLKKNASELESLNRMLKDLAIRDGLTGLYNHRYFRESLDGELGRCRRHDRPLSLIFMDVDHFKKYNDTNGHLAGDELLKKLGRLIEEDSRASTVAARYGGEEFVLMVPESGKEGALRYAERIRQKVESYPFEGRENQPGGRVTISLGVATFPEDGGDSTGLLANADQALYQAKDHGRNAVAQYAAA